MSFKRDGSDTGLLKNLQHRRVAEILGDHIPEDEASLLSNGRLTCTVCSRRPIFDTMQMLSLHRKGKKHLLELSLYLQYKRDLEVKKAKQTQRSFLKTEQITIKTDSTSLALGSYSRTLVKRNANLSGRKFVLDITESGDRMKNNLPTVFPSSANSQVRRYLKSLSRKRPLEKTVNKLRENYGGRVTQTKGKTETKSESKASTENVSSSTSTSSREMDYQIKLLESGWVQDLKGKWVKDPNVEFDSDEEEPPLFS